MRVTRFTEFIRNACEHYLGQEVYEDKGQNKGDKIKEIFALYNKNPHYRKINYPTAWCAVTASAILERASLAYNGQHSTIGDPATTSISTIAKKHGIVTDKIPAIGAVMMSASSQAATKHAQIVYNIIQKGKTTYIVTCEGNGDAKMAYNIPGQECWKKVRIKDGLHSRIKPLKKSDLFVHVENMWGTNDMIDYKASDFQVEQVSGFAPAGSVAFADKDDAGVLINEEGREYCVVEFEEDIEGNEPGSPSEADLNKIFGLPKQYVYLGGGVALLCGMFWLMRRD